MQIVIGIPDEYKEDFDFNRCEDHFNSLVTDFNFYAVLRKGFKQAVILPEKHGRLIDANKLEEEIFRVWGMGETVRYYITKESLDEAPTVIEAERG